MKFSFSACDLGQVTHCLGMESVEREGEREKFELGEGLWHHGGVVIGT